MAGTFVPDAGDRLRVQVDPHTRSGQVWRNKVRRGEDGGTRDIARTFRFSNIWEEGFEEQAEVNYSATEIVGRSESYQTWVNNSNRTIPIVFKFHAEGSASREEDIEDVIVREVIDPVRWLEALSYPLLSNSGEVLPPPPVFLQVGQLYRGRAIVTEATPKWHPKWEQQTALTHYAEISVTFTEVAREPGDYRIRGARRLGTNKLRFTGGTRTSRAENAIPQSLRKTRTA